MGELDTPRLTLKRIFCYTKLIHGKIVQTPRPPWLTLLQKGIAYYLNFLTVVLYYYLAEPLSIEVLYQLQLCWAVWDYWHIFNKHIRINEVFASGVHSFKKAARAHKWVGKHNSKSKWDDSLVGKSVCIGKTIKQGFFVGKLGPPHCLISLPPSQSFPS